MIFFASDVHLASDTPAITARFLSFLERARREAQSVYLLGDIFESWVGDEDLGLKAYQPVFQALKETVQAGVAVYFMAGNRDFMVSDHVLAELGLIRLEDPYILSTTTWQFVLSHGDLYCTGDVPYQKFRARVRDPQTQARFLRLPYWLRRSIATWLRWRSKGRRYDAQTQMMTDVSQGTVEDEARRYGYATLIHGHTHRPATHDLFVDGIHVERWVLADWSADRGEYLTWNDTELSRQSI
ncbi:MAG: UDP-2,3-diacylglucosamine diphosphatase [Fluviibacter phosphoraccumulans]|jgi:UDP-2,3-diacylglucosamine hydrolase